jgi:hypothetical protein
MDSNNQLGCLTHEDELNVYFDNSAPAPADLDAGFIDWTMHSGFYDGAWTHTTNEGPLYAGSGLLDTML